ncbi:AI-2E family transporter [Methylobacterium nigriterrae]|uniref:AI-2E family transporter n=1 Tax=Methylobacterium nigriterrae TaxID=3127512 RepID=UPI0030140F0E
MTADRGLRISAGILAVLGLLTAASAAVTVLAPMTFALFLIAIVRPLQCRLQARLPRPVALAVTLTAIVVALLGIAALAAWAFGQVAQSLIADAGRLQSLYEFGAAWLGERGILVSGIWSEHFNVSWLVRTLQGVTGKVNTAVSFWVVALVYVILGLIEVDDAARRIAALDRPELARILTRGSAETAVKLRRFVLVRTAMSLVTGILVWCLTAAVGLRFAAEWGVIAFVLNYIPFIGPLIATAFPTIFALTQFESWQAAAGIFVGLNLIQFVVGSYAEPRVSGTALAMSPFVVLFAVFFWMYLWGLAGAFIGVPITITVLTFCAQHPATRWIAGLMGNTVPAR